MAQWHLKINEKFVFCLAKNYFFRKSTFFQLKITYFFFVAGVCPLENKKIFEKFNNCVYLKIGIPVDKNWGIRFPKKGPRGVWLLLS